MSSRKVFLIILSVFLCSLLVAFGSLSYAASISGIVRDDNGVPIAALQVFATDYVTNDWIDADYTDSSGNYTITGLSIGTYRVRACASCESLPYIDEFYDDTTDYSAVTPIELTVTTPDTSGIDFSLEQGGTIPGNATLEGSSTPINNLHIYAVMYDTGEWISGTNTQPDGSYSLRVPTGIYKVCTCTNCSGLGYVDECYDNVYGQHNADPVSVTEPDNTPNIDFSLAVGGTISGTVLDTNNNPIADLHLYAINVDNDQWTGGTNTHLDGIYSLRLPTGTYEVNTCSDCSDLNYSCPHMT